MGTTETLKADMASRMQAHFREAVARQTANERLVRRVTEIRPRDLSAATLAALARPSAMDRHADAVAAFLRRTHAGSHNPIASIR